MRYLTLTVLLAAMIPAAAGERIPQKNSYPERTFRTEGKTIHEGSPRTGLMFGESVTGFSYEIPEMAGQEHKTSPLKSVSDSGTDLQGFLKASSSADFPPGWYDIDICGDVSQIFSNTAMMGSCGFVREGRICQFTTISSYGYYWFYYSEYSLEDGEQLYEIELSDTDMRNYIINCTYDEKEDVVYMQSYSRNFSAMAWSAFDPATRERTYLNNSLSWDDNRVIAIGTNPRDSRIYGIRENGEFVEIDRMSGEVSRKGVLGVEPAGYSQSMTYAPMERGFVWAAMLSDNTSGFYRIDPADGSCSLLGKMPAQNQFLMLWCPDRDAPDDSPAMPGIDAVFEGPALSGRLAVTFPSDSFGGAPIATGSDLETEILIDGTLTATLHGNPGSIVYCDISVPQGEHHILARCRNAHSGENKWGPEYKSVFYAGYDAPLPPENVTITGNTIKWTPPTGSVHGGYVNSGSIRYSVSLNDIAVTSDPITATSVSFEDPTSLGIYHARVVAIADGMMSEPGVSEGIRYGQYLDFPFHFTPTSEEFSLFSVIDGNRDGNSWRYFDGKDCVYYNTGASKSADEWLLLPPADFYDSGHLYKLSFEVKSLLLSRPEDFEICLLAENTQEPAIVKNIATFPAYDNDEWTEESIKFNIDNPGRYHIAFHCTTPEGFQLMLRSFRCDKTSDTMKAPAECKGVELSAEGNGQLEGRASFFAPTKALDGSALDAGTEITVYARTAAGEGETKVLPGVKGEVRFPCVQGNNRVILVSSNEGGEGIEKNYTLFAGQEKPGRIENLETSVSDDNLSMTISWDAPTAGESGGYINPDEVGYYIYTASGDELAFLEDIGTQRSYTLSVSPGQQSLQQLAVGTYNVAGAASSASFRGTSAILGTPLQIPFEETFAYGIPRWLPNVISRPNSSYTVQWGHGDPTAIVYDAITPDYGCMYAQPSVPGHSLGRVEIPRVSTAGYRNATFTMNAYRFPQGGTLRILGRANDSKTFVEIGELDCSKGSKGYVESIFRLPEELQGCPWVAIAIEAEFDCESTTSYVILDGYRLVDLPDNDLAVTDLLGPDRLKSGEWAAYSATVTNKGKFTQTSHVVWEVTDSEGSVIISDTKIVSPLDPGESESSDFEFSTDGIPLGSIMTVRATVVADPDDTEANNSCKTPVALISAASGTVNDLSASVSDGHVTLEWSAPQMIPSLNDDFGSVENGTYAQSLGVWKNIDRDGKNTCSIRGVELPDAGVPKAWQVIDESIHELFSAHKGSRMLLAMTPADESAANDWLISPAVAGGSEVVFSADILADGFNETFELLVSSTDDDPSSFSLFEAFSKSAKGWETYMVTLPAHTRHFAIRYCSVDQFGLMLDDIDYVPADNPAKKITGYHVYRQETMIDKCVEPGYQDTDPLSEATYYIVPLVDYDGSDTETVRSNSVYVSLTGVSAVRSAQRLYGIRGHIVAEGFEDGVMDIFAMDGMKVASAALSGERTVVSVPAGIYAVTCGRHHAKIIVNK